MPRVFGKSEEVDPAKKYQDTLKEALSEIEELTKVAKTNMGLLSGELVKNWGAIDIPYAQDYLTGARGELAAETTKPPLTEIHASIKREFDSIMRAMQDLDQHCLELEAKMSDPKWMSSEEAKPPVFLNEAEKIKWSELKKLAGASLTGGDMDRSLNKQNLEKRARAFMTVVRERVRGEVQKPWESAMALAGETDERIQEAAGIAKKLGERQELLRSIDDTKKELGSEGDATMQRGGEGLLGDLQKKLKEVEKGFGRFRKLKELIAKKTGWIYQDSIKEKGELQKDIAEVKSDRKALGEVEVKVATAKLGEEGRYLPPKVATQPWIKATRERAAEIRKKHGIEAPEPETPVVGSVKEPATPADDDGAGGMKPS